MSRRPAARAALAVLALGAFVFGTAEFVIVGVLDLVARPWGLAGFGMDPAIQLRVVSLAGPGADLAASLSASAVNAGIAAGSLVGGVAYAGYGVEAPMQMALLLCALALPATWSTRRLTVPEDPVLHSLGQPAHTPRP